MSFQQHNKDPEAAWRKYHREELLQNGLLASVVDDKRQWNYVLLHGTDDFGSGWDVSWISKDQAGHLLTLVRSQYTNPVGLELIVVLQKRNQEE